MKKLILQMQISVDGFVGANDEFHRMKCGASWRGQTCRTSVIVWPLRSNYG